MKREDLEVISALKPLGSDFVAAYESSESIRTIHTDTCM